VLASPLVASTELHLQATHGFLHIRVLMQKDYSSIILKVIVLGGYFSQCPPLWTLWHSMILIRQPVLTRWYLTGIPLFCIPRWFCDSAAFHEAKESFMFLHRNLIQSTCILYMWNKIVYLFAARLPNSLCFVFHEKLQSKLIGCRFPVLHKW